VTREEIVSAVKNILFGAKDNAAIDQLLDELEDALPNAEICDLIFQDRRNLTPEQIADEAIQKEAEHRARTAKP